MAPYEHVIFDACPPNPVRRFVDGDRDWPPPPMEPNRWTSDRGRLGRSSDSTRSSTRSSIPRPRSKCSPKALSGAKGPSGVAKAAACCSPISRATRSSRWKEGEGLTRVSQAVGLHRPGTAGRGAVGKQPPADVDEQGSNGAGDRRRRPARALPARRPATSRGSTAPLSADNKPEAKFVTGRRSLGGQAVQQPQRLGDSLERRHLLHRSALRPRKGRRPDDARDRLQRRLPRGARRRGDARHPRDDQAQRPGVLARPEDAVRRPVGQRDAGVASVRRAGRRLARPGPQCSSTPTTLVTKGLARARPTDSRSTSTATSSPPAPAACW